MIPQINVENSMVEDWWWGESDYHVPDYSRLTEEDRFEHELNEGDGRWDDGYYD